MIAVARPTEKVWGMKNRISLIIFVSLMTFGLSGCTSLRWMRVLTPGDKGLAMKLTPKQNYEYDFSTPGLKTGRLIIDAEPPSNQFTVYEYVIELDNDKNIQVSKHSHTEIVLDVGKHTLKIYAPASTLKGIYGNVFGKPSVFPFEMKDNKWVIINYEGPFSMIEAGVLKLKEI